MPPPLAKAVQAAISAAILRPSDKARIGNQRIAFHSLVNDRSWTLAKNELTSHMQINRDQPT
jgi:hypothetical protein